MKVTINLFLNQSKTKNGLLKIGLINQTKFFLSLLKQCLDHIGRAYVPKQEVFLALLTECLSIVAEEMTQGNTLGSDLPKTCSDICLKLRKCIFSKAKQTSLAFGSLQISFLKFSNSQMHSSQSQMCYIFNFSKFSKWHHG